MEADRSQKSLQVVCQVSGCMELSKCKNRCKKHYDKFYRQQNKEKIAAQVKKYQMEHREEIRSWYKEWAKTTGKEAYKNRRDIENYKKWIQIYRKRPLVAKLHLARCKERKLRKLKRTPKWAKLDLIRQFYLNCPKGHHVDHIIPLCGKLVSGLHVLSNLQYLPASENIRKLNKFEPYVGYKPGDVKYVGN